MFGIQIFQKISLLLYIIWKNFYKTDEIRAKPIIGYKIY